MGWVGGCGGQGQERATERCARFTSCLSLTSGQAAVGATQIDAAVRDGRDAKLVVGTGEKGRQSAGKNKVPLTGSASHGNTDLRQEFTESQIHLYAGSLKAYAGKREGFMPGAIIVLLTFGSLNPNICHLTGNLSRALSQMVPPSTLINILLLNTPVVTAYHHSHA